MRSQGFKANPGLEFANAFSVWQPGLKPEHQRRSRIKQLHNSNQLHFQIEFSKNKSPWGFEQKPSERS
jgi:hypothetical protein